MEGRRSAVSGLMFLVLSVAAPLMSKDGKLALRVTPNQAYVFIDGIAQRDGGGRFKLSPGEHTLALRNYGYKTVTQKFTIAPGKATRLSVALESEPGEVSGPWGRIQFKGPRRSVVLLNGKVLDHFVGHVGEFNSGKRELLVPPGKYEISVLHPGDNAEIYSGSITVNASEGVIINLNRNGEQARTSWAPGERLKSLPPFMARRGSVTVAVRRVTANLSARPASINCGESTELEWTTTGASEAEISGVGAVPTRGDRSVRPNAATTYKLAATGPGGLSESGATVSVNKAITVELHLSPEEDPNPAPPRCILWDRSRRRRVPLRPRLRPLSPRTAFISRRVFLLRATRLGNSCQASSACWRSSPAISKSTWNSARMLTSSWKVTRTSVARRSTTRPFPNAAPSASKSSCSNKESARKILRPSHSGRNVTWTRKLCGAWESKILTSRKTNGERFSGTCAGSS